MSAGFAAAIAAAGRSGALVPAAAIVPPPTLADALAAQAEIVLELGAAVAGWKLGFSPGGVPVPGPMLAGTVLGSGAAWPLPAIGAVLVEVEIAFRLAHDLPMRSKPYQAADILAGIGEVLVGIEVLRSRMEESPAPAFNAWLADRLGNAGYVCGEAAAPFADLAKLRCRMWVDGALAHDKPGGHPQGDPLAPLLAYANAQSDGLGGLRAGQVITTGSLTAPLRCERPQLIEAEVEGIGKVALRLAR